MEMVLDFLVSTALTDTTKVVEAEIVKMLCVNKEIESLQQRLKTINGYLQQAKQKRYKNDDNLVRELTAIMYDADDVIDLCMIEEGKLLKARALSNCLTVSIPCNYIFSCFQCLKNRHDIANQIIALNNKLEELKKDMPMIQYLEQPNKEEIEYVNRMTPHETSYLQVEEDIIGTQIENATENLVGWIFRNNPKKGHVFGVVGTGGIGKSTLASKILEDKRIKDKFSNRIWLCVSKNYMKSDLPKMLIKFEEGNETKEENLEGKSKVELENKFMSVLAQNTFIVLDDVWNPSVWVDFLRKPIKKSAASCTVLVTSRQENVIEKMNPIHVHRVEKMDEESGWALLKHLVFEGEGDEDEISSLEEIGIKLVKKCDGLPLAIKAIAGVLRKENKAKWEEVLESDAWNMNGIEQELRPLYLSFEDLPPRLKQCFLYCSLYPQKDMYYKEIVQFWAAEGLLKYEHQWRRDLPTKKPRTMEDLGEEIYRALICRNLLEADANLDWSKSHFSMHDHFRSLCANLMREEGILYRHGEELKVEDMKIRRLSVSYMGSKLELPRQIIKQACLRTLIVTDSSKIKMIEDSVLQALPCLRVLNLSRTSIEKIPDCIGDLRHLRYLDLAATNICEIPATIGKIVNLQTLNIGRCQYLERLPASITELHNLRWLDMRDCQLLTYVPKGIGKLQNFYSLYGFIVGPNNSDSEDGCDLEELKNLSKLRGISIYRLERAEGGASALENKHCLKQLTLGWMQPVVQEEEEKGWSKEQISNAERICNEMAQSSLNIFDIVFYGYPGQQLPSWMASSSLSESLPNLTYLKLLGLPCCTALPPLGTLPQLKYLSIEGASAITTIGPQFLGSKTSAFPKLEVLLFEGMLEWKEWTFNGTPLAVKLFPSLRECTIFECPKLTALPDGLDRATNLNQLCLSRTYELGEIDKLTLACKLQVRNGIGLKKISNLSLLRYLEVDDCPALECVKDLGELQHLVLICSDETEQLPQWLPGLIEQDNNTASSNRSLKKFEMKCNLLLLNSCRRGNENWDIIKQISAVKIQTYYGKDYIRYSKVPDNYDEHVASD